MQEISALIGDNVLDMEIYENRLKRILIPHLKRPHNDRENVVLNHPPPSKHQLEKLPKPTESDHNRHLHMMGGRVSEGLRIYSSLQNLEFIELMEFTVTNCPKVSLVQPSYKYATWVCSEVL